MGFRSSQSCATANFKNCVNMAMRALIEAGPALRPPGFGGTLIRNAFYALQRSRVISFM